MLFECKAAGVRLTDNLRGQLNDYFVSNVKTRIGVLTNGAEYEFFTDIDNSNMMDDTPFLAVNLSEPLTDDDANTLRQFTKENFDLDQIRAAAEELKYVNVMMVTLREQLSGPGDELVRLLTPPNGRLDRFRPFAAQAIDAVLRESARAMLDTSAPAFSTPIVESTPVLDDEEPSSGVETTQDELDAFEVVKSVLSETIDASRLSLHDTVSHCNVIVDGKRRNYTVCRFIFRQTVKHLLTLDTDGSTSTAHLLEDISDIEIYRDELVARAQALA